MYRKSTLHIRAGIISTIRDFFNERGFLEIETPSLIPANAPEENIEPISALHWQLQTSPEICMKRMLCRGYDKIFQICRCWRANERGSRHLSEFSMLEWYRSNADYNDLMDDCMALLRNVALKCTEEPFFSQKGHKINPMGIWQKISVQEAFSSFANADALESSQNGLFDEILTSVVEPSLANFDTPVILMDYPAELAALSRIKDGNPDFAERFELYLGGVELANGFSELNDPVEQRRRFEEANEIRCRNGRIKLPLPEPFLAELSAMPESAGIALGLDRLVMLTVGADSIDQVIAFSPESL